MRGFFYSIAVLHVEGLSGLRFVHPETMHQTIFASDCMRIYSANFGLFRVWLAVVAWLVSLATGIGFARLEFVQIHSDKACAPGNIRDTLPIDGVVSFVEKILAFIIVSPIAMVNGLWAGALQCLPALIAIAILAIAFAEFPYQRRRALGIVTIPSFCATLVLTGYFLAAHQLATTGCYPALLDAPRY